MHKKIKSFFKNHMLLILLIIAMAIVTYMTVPTLNKAHGDIDAGAEREKRLNQTIDLLIEELYEEKHMRSICQEAVERWTTDAKARQEVKNEARRLRERNKKKEIVK